jgi:hypothetical protein
MRQIYIILIVILTTGSAVFAQAYEGSVKYDKEKQDAIVIEYRYPAQAVENAFVQRMQRLGYKPKEEKGILNRDKGFLVFKNVNIPEISGKRYDYIIYVERKSRKEDDESIMYMIVKDNDANMVKKLPLEESGQAKEYLNEMSPDIEAAHLELQINAQQEVVNKAEKKLRDLEDEHSSLVKKLQDNDKDREDTRSDIEAQRKALDILRDKRRTD